MGANSKCNLCDLHTTSRVVCLSGDGPIPSDVMCITEAPGESDEAKRHLLVGKIGRFYDDCLKEAGLSREEVYSTSVVRCHPPVGRKPLPKEIAACRPYLEREIRKVKPKVIVLMGATAVTSVLGLQNPVIKSHRGVRIKSQEFDCDVVITYNPGAVLPCYDPQGKRKREFISDLRRAKLGEAEGVVAKSVVVKTIRELKRVYAKVVAADGVSYDTENGGDTSDDALNPFRNVFLCLSLSVDGETGYVIPWRRQGRKFYWPSADRKQAKELIQKILTEMEQKAFISGNNIVYDNLTLRNQGFNPPRPNFDNMIGDVLLDENRSHSLESQAARWTKLGNYKGAFSLFMGQNKIQDFSQVPDKELWQYTGFDAVASWLVSRVIKGLLQEYRRTNEVFTNMMKFSNICELMSWRGVRLDLAKLHETSHDVNGRLTEWQNKLRKWSGTPTLNIDSPPQLRKIFFETNHGTCRKAHRPIKTSETTGEPSTDKAVLEVLKANGCGFADTLLLCRYWGKIRNTYLTGKDGQGGILQHVEADGQVHPRWNQHLVKTQRLSANKPPMQTLPRGNIIRNLFVPKEGYHFVMGDSKQSELRVIAVLAGDEPLLNTFKDGGDPHAETGAIISKVPLEKVTKEQRQRGKGVNFSIVFLQGARSLGASIGVSEEKAQKYLNDWYKVHFKVKAFQEKLKRQILTRGFVESPHGRLRHFPEVGDKLFAQQNEDLRAGINHPVQCGSRLMVQRVMLKLQEKFEEHPRWDAGFVVDSHDGFVIEVKAKYSKKVEKLVREIGEIPDPDLDGYSFPWDVKICEERWDEGKG